MNAVQFYFEDAEHGPAFLSGINPVLKDRAGVVIDPIRSHRVKVDSVRRLEPGDNAEFVFNLKDWYELDDPGAYELNLSFTTENSGFASGVSNTIEFILE